MTLHHMLSLAAMGGWLLLVVTAPWLSKRHRVRTFWILVLLGVPTLGWLTLLWGPGIGVGAFAIGLWAMMLRPLRPRDQVVRAAENG